MRDYNYVDETGRHRPTSELPTGLIQEILADGIEISDSDGESDLEDAVRERLRLELTIRALGLSSQRKP